MKYTVEVRENGDIFWYKENTCTPHREGDLPAVERVDGSKAWYQNGELHRDGLPAIIQANGTKQWFQHYRLHRTDGPAIEFADGSKEWYRNGHLHREDGPAVEGIFGAKQFWLKGERVSDQEVLIKLNSFSKDSCCDGKIISFEGKKYKLVLV